MTTPEQSTATPVERSINGAADGHDSDAQPTATRFAPIIAAAKEPPFTAYHAKYLAYELTKQVGAEAETVPGTVQAAGTVQSQERFERPASFEGSLRS